MSKRFRFSAGKWVLFGAVAALPLMGCGGGGEGNAPAQDDQPASQALSDEAQELVNQGNAAQRAGSYQEALDYFTQALEIHPNHPVPQFGSLLAAAAVGDTALARSLREKLEVTGPELLGMLGPGGGMGGMAPGTPGVEHIPGGALPQGHPDLETIRPDTLNPAGTGRRG